MFTGLVEEIGTVREIARSGVGASLRVECAYRDYVLGESIAVNGACLSVTRVEGMSFWADCSAETLDKTTLGELTTGSKVHLERALAHGARVGGHIVTGHVDGVGRIASREPLGKAQKMELEVPPQLAPFLAPKGSVSVDGTSLTINGARGTRFDVVLVPVTQDKTLLLSKPVGSRVNLEVDVLAKYVARLLNRPGIDGQPADNPLVEGSQHGGLTLEGLAKAGYL